MEVRSKKSDSRKLECSRGLLGACLFCGYILGSGGGRHLEVLRGLYMVGD